MTEIATVTARDGTQKIIVTQQDGTQNLSVEQADNTQKISVSPAIFITNSGEKVYDGSYIVTPSVLEQTLYTKNTLLTDNVEIQAIPYSETSNTSGGTTINIG